MPQQDLNLELVGRLATVETKTEVHAQELAAHDALLSQMDKQVGTLVSEVRQIRNALYALALAAAANVPALQGLGESLKHMLGM